MRRATFCLPLLLILCGGAPDRSEAPPRFLLAWGSSGSREGKLNHPSDLALDDEGRVYVADSGHGKIRVFDGEGRFLAAWDLGGRPSDVHVENGVLLVAVLKQGRVVVQERALDGTLRREEPATSEIPFSRSVAVGPGGERFRIDHSEIQVFDTEGTLVGSWGLPGSGPGELRSPEGIAVDLEGNVYVTDTFNHRVQKFSKEGYFLTEWGSRSGKPPVPGEFFGPSGIAVDPEGNVYVADFFNDRIQKFGPVP